MGTIDLFEERLPAIIEPSFYLGSRKYTTLKLENRRGENGRGNFGWAEQKNLAGGVKRWVNCCVRFPRIERRKLAKIAKAAGKKAKDAGAFLYRHRKEILDVVIAIGTAVAAGRGGRSGRGRKR